MNSSKFNKYMIIMLKKKKEKVGLVLLFYKTSKTTIK